MFSSFRFYFVFSLFFSLNKLTSLAFLTLAILLESKKSGKYMVEEFLITFILQHNSIERRLKNMFLSGHLAPMLHPSMLYKINNELIFNRLRTVYMFTINLKFEKKNVFIFYRSYPIVVLYSFKFYFVIWITNFFIKISHEFYSSVKVIFLPYLAQFIFVKTLGHTKTFLLFLLHVQLLS